MRRRNCYRLQNSIFSHIFDSQGYKNDEEDTPEHVLDIVEDDSEHSLEDHL